MDQAITGSYHLHPREVRMIILKAFGHAPRSFTDDFNRAGKSEI